MKAVTDKSQHVTQNCMTLQQVKQHRLKKILNSSLLFRQVTLKLCLHWTVMCLPKFTFLVLRFVGNKIYPGPCSLAKRAWNSTCPTQQNRTFLGPAMDYFLDQSHDSWGTGQHVVLKEPQYMYHTCKFNNNIKLL